MQERSNLTLLKNNKEYEQKKLVKYNDIEK